MHGDADGRELFGTETMAELCARQGRIADAVAIYRRLCAGGADAERQARWSARLRALEGQGVVAAAVGRETPRAPEVVARPTEGASSRTTHVLPLVVREPVRAGQIVYAESTDLIVLAPVNPGAELMADGNIHVYAPLRGRAVAGVRGAREARIFCQRLEAQLVGVDVAYLTAEDLAPERFGKPAQIAFEGSRCVVTPL